jgi:plasmid stability protein
MQRVTVNLPDDVYAELVARAQADGRSLSSTAKVLLTLALVSSLRVEQAALDRAGSGDDPPSSSPGPVSRVLEGRG